jgi:tyrosyl-tRNA synthetase
MSLSEDLTWRGLIKDKTFDDIKWLDEPNKTFYHGVDATSDSLTIGNLAALILARRLIEAGWKAVLLVGGATTLIGDPGGKTQERERIPRTDVERNKEAIKEKVQQLFSGKPFKLYDNNDWWNGKKDENGKAIYTGVNYLDFLREYGKRFSMTELMQREFVTERMGERGSGISYAEFSYGLVQGYDFYQLNEKEVDNEGNKLNVVLQIGGSDQWSNMLMGVSLIRKKTENVAHALSMPLVINKATGQKFGKTEAGAIWLDGIKTTPFQFYQFWINVGDDSAEDFLKIYTLLEREQIESIVEEFKQNPAERQAQKVLAYEVTKIVHGEEQAKTQRHVTEVLFSGQGIENLNNAELATVREEFPKLTIGAGTPIVDVLVETGLVQSKSEARRLKESGAIYINNEKADKDHLDASDFRNGKLLIRRGKAFKDSALIELV